MVNSGINMVNSKLGISQTDSWAQLTYLLIAIIIALIVDHYGTKIILGLINRITKKSKTALDDILLNEHIIAHLCHLIAPVLIYMSTNLIIPDEHWASIILKRLTLIYIVISVILFINGFIKAMYFILNGKSYMKDKPIKGLTQIIIVCIWIIGIIISISIIINESPMKLIATLGASAAILMLVFKDTITGFVSGIQLSANNMLAVGDWISVPKYGADGTVIDVTLNTVKVQNWDNTITTIPPYVLTADSFTNWKGMSESGGRRIKRSFNIDINSIKFCDYKMIEKFKKIELIKDYIEKKELEISEYNNSHKNETDIPINERKQTNIGIFRAYISNYIGNLDVINHDMTYMVRQLQTNDKGIPIEIYCFSKIKDWVEYEKIQSDIFDHIYASAPVFDLRIYQEPSGNDFRSLKE